MDNRNNHWETGGYFFQRCFEAGLNWIPIVNAPPAIWYVVGVQAYWDKKRTEEHKNVDQNR